MALAGTLEVQLLADVARIKADMDKAVGHITSGAKAMNIAAAGVKAALGGIVAGLSVAAFAGWIKGAIDAADAASKLAQKTGLAVKDVAGMELAFKLAGLEGAAMSTSVARLSKSLVDNNKGLEALGIKTKDAGGAMRSTKAVLYDVADQIAKMPDGLQKTAIAVEIFGRAGADMVPLLNGGAQGMREMDAMAQKLGLTIDEQTAKSAEQFNDTLDLIGMGSRGVANGIAAQLLPTLTSLAGSFLESMTSGDKLRVIADILAGSLKALFIAGKVVAEVFSTVGKTLGAAAGQIVAILSGDFARARQIGMEWAQDIRKDWSSLVDSSIKVWNDEAGAAVAAASKIIGSQKDLLAAAKAREEAAKKAAAAAKKEAEEFAALRAKLTGKETGTDADFLKNLKLLADGGRKAGLSMAEIIRLQELYIAQQPYMVKAAKERQAEFAVTAETTKELADAEVAESQARERARLAVDAYARGIGETHDQLKLELSLVGATEAARKRALALYKIELDLKQQIAAIEDFRTGFDEAQREEERAKARAAAAQARANVELQAEIDVAEKAQKEWESTNKQIADSFVDNLMRGGKSVAQYLKDLFRTLVLRPLLAPIGSAVAGVAGSALGMPAAAQGVGGSLVGSAAGSAAGSWLGSTMAGGSFLSGVSGASAALAGGSTFGVTGAIGSIPAAIGTGGTGLAGAAGSMGAGVSGALGAIPVWGWALMAGLAIASLAKGGETRAGGKYTNTGFLEGPSGGEINAEATRTAIGATMQGINETLRALGATATLTELQSGFEQSKNGKGFAYAGGTLSTGETFGQTHGAGWQNRRGSMTAEEAAAAFGEELKQATLQALQEAGVPGILGDYLRSLGDIDELSGGSLDAALARINKALGEKQSLEDRYFELTHTQEEVLARNREREREALDESNRALYDQIAALEDQARLTGDVAAASVTLVAALDSLRNPLRTVEEIAQSIFNLEREGQGLQVDLLRAQGNDPAARALQRALDTAGFTAAEVALYDYNQSLRDQIQGIAALRAAEEALAAQRDRVAGKFAAAAKDFMSADEYRAFTADGIVSRLGAAGMQVSREGVLGASKDDVRRLYGEASRAGNMDLAEAILDASAAFLTLQPVLEDTAAAAARVAQERFGLEGQLLQLQGNTAALRERERGALDESNRALYDQIVALQDLKTASDAAAQAAERVAQERFGLETRLLQLQGNTGELRRRELQALDPANRALQEQIYALEDMAGAAAKAEEATRSASRAFVDSMSAVVAGIENKWQELFTSIRDEVARIRGLWLQDDGQSLAGARGAFLAAAATAAGGGSGAEAAGWMLPALSQSMLTLAQSQSASFLELRQLQAATAATLEGTLGGLSGARNAEFERLAALFAPMRSYDVGTPFVPSTGPALVHQGEAIIPARFNPFASAANDSTADEIRQLREENRAQAASIAALNARMVKLLERWDGDGMPETRAVA